MSPEITGLRRQDCVDMRTQLVWFKRDLRVHDNAALSSAAALGPVMCVYIVEPSYWRSPDASQRQFDFLRE